MRTATLEQNRQRGHERYEEYRRFEEATDIAERIGYPIDHTVNYLMRGGFAYGEFDSKNRPFHELTNASRHEGHRIFTGVNAFEAVRREHEHQEALLVDQFGRGELEGTVLVKISPVPDAVQNGTADIDGYRRDLLRSFVRIYYRTEHGVACRLFSLDQSDPVGMAAIGDLLGIDIDGRSSEDILSDHSLVNIENISDNAIDELVAQTKNVYDNALELQTNERFHAGSRMLNKDNALRVIMRHDSLLTEHMREITKIMQKVRDPGDQKRLLEVRRKRTSAAIDIVERGGVISSSNDSSVSDRMSTNDYGGECATDSLAKTVAMTQGAEKKRELKKGTCLACFKEGDVGECSVCLKCEADDNRGVDLMKVRTQALKAIAAANRHQQQASEMRIEKSSSKTDIIKSKYGKYAEERKGEVKVGYAPRIIYDRRTGAVLDTL